MVMNQRFLQADVIIFFTQFSSTNR